MKNEVLTVSEYLAIFLRRKLTLLGTIFIVMLGFVGLAYVLPAMYNSSGTILIEQQEVPEGLVEGTITGYANERIQIVSKRVMTRDTVVAIIDEFDLYAEDRAAGVATGEVVGQFRESTSLQNLSAELTSNVGRSYQSTIAFNIGFDSPSPRTAQLVAAKLVDLYLEENTRSRTEAAIETSAFLARRAQTLDAELNQQEQELAEFKEQLGDSLPDLQRLNLDRLEATDRNIDNMQREIRSLKDMRDLLGTELAVVSPYASYEDSGDSMLTAPQRLDSLQRQYITLASKYGPKHPNLIMVRKEIELLTGTEVEADLRAIGEQLHALRLDLQMARQQYSSSHPNVARIENQISELERQRTQVLSDSTKNLQPTNPLYIQKQGQLTATKNELATAEQQMVDLLQKSEDYERRLTRSPQVEREYSAMLRDYQAKMAQFREIEDKRETALLAESLEVEQKGERFTLIDPPRVPDEPFSPNRVAIILLGAVLAVGAGLGLAAITDAIDTTVRGVRDIVDVIDAPPLASIMYVENAEDVVSRRTRNAMITGAALASIAVVVAIVI